MFWCDLVLNPEVTVQSEHMGSIRRDERLNMYSHIRMVLPTVYYEDNFFDYREENQPLYVMKTHQYSCKSRAYHQDAWFLYSKQEKLK